MREVRLERGEHVGLRQARRSRNQLHQRADLAGGAAFSVDDRVEQVGHIADHRDRGSVCFHAVFGERRSSPVEDPLAGIEARGEVQAHHDRQDHQTGYSNHEPRDGVRVPNRGLRHSSAHFPSGR